MIRLDELPDEVREVCEAAMNQEGLCGGKGAHGAWWKATLHTEAAARRLAAKMEEKPCE